MQFTVLINQARSLEWGLTAQQAMLFSFVYGAAGWADSIERGGVVYFFLNRHKVCDEMPLLTDKPDTVYRLLKQLETKGLVRLLTEGNKPFVSITRKGALWNNSMPPEREASSDSAQSEPPRVGQISDPEPQGSENYPSRVGKLSEQGSENYPTDHITSNQITKISKVNNNINSQLGDLAEFDISRFEPPDSWADLWCGELDSPPQQILAEFRVYHSDLGTRTNLANWHRLLQGWARRRVLSMGRDAEGVNHA